MAKPPPIPKHNSAKPPPLPQAAPSTALVVGHELAPTTPPLKARTVALMTRFVKRPEGIVTFWRECKQEKRRGQAPFVRWELGPAYNGAGGSLDDGFWGWTMVTPEEWLRIQSLFSWEAAMVGRPVVEGEGQYEQPRRLVPEQQPLLFVDVAALPEEWQEVFSNMAEGYQTFFDHHGVYPGDFDLDAARIAIPVHGLVCLEGRFKSLVARYGDRAVRAIAEAERARERPLVTARFVANRMATLLMRAQRCAETDNAEEKALLNNAFYEFILFMEDAPYEDERLLERVEGDLQDEDEERQQAEEDAREEREMEALLAQEEWLEQQQRAHAAVAAQQGNDLWFTIVIILCFVMPPLGIALLFLMFPDIAFGLLVIGLVLAALAAGAIYLFVQF